MSYQQRNRTHLDQGNEPGHVRLGSEDTRRGAHGRGSFEVINDMAAERPWFPLKRPPWAVLRKRPVLLVRRPEAQGGPGVVDGYLPDRLHALIGQVPRGTQPGSKPASRRWPDPEHEVLLAESVGLALLVVLDALTPAERLAFVLHDVFGVSSLVAVLDPDVELRIDGGVLRAEASLVLRGAEAVAGYTPPIPGCTHS
jgi:hypothetical protein